MGTPWDAGEGAAPAGGARYPAPGRLRGPRPPGIMTALRGARWTGTGRSRVTPVGATSQEARAWS